MDYAKSMNKRRAKVNKNISDNIKNSGKPLDVSGDEGLAAQAKLKRQEKRDLELANKGGGRNRSFMSSSDVMAKGGTVRMASGGPVVDSYDYD